MKKFISIFLCALMILTIAAGCSVTQTVQAPAPTAAPAAPAAPASSDSSAAAPAAPAEPAKKDRNVQLSFGGSSTGGVMYYMAGAFSDIVTPLVEGVNITNVTTGAAVDNAIKTATGELDLSITYGAICYEAATGTGNFENNQYTDLAQNIKGIGKGYDSDFYFVSLAKNNINTLADLTGKTIACGNAGSGTQYVADIVLDYLDCNTKREYISFADGTTAMKEGRVDVVCQSGSPSGALTELANTDDIVIIPFDDATLDGLIAEYPFFFKDYMEKETYKGMTEDVLLPHFTVYIICNASVPDDVMYDIMTAVYTDGVLAKMAEGHKNWKSFAEDTETFEALGLEIHPGVKAFYADHPEFCS